jgi:putative ABC transport system permease protein
MLSFAQDLRYAVRLFGRAPAFTAVAVITLALGIGATTALFNVVYAVLLRPLPYADPERLVMIRAIGADGTPQPVLSGAEIADLRDARVFSSVGGLVAVDGNLTDASDGVEMEQVPAANATDDFLTTLGIRPARGRLLDVRRDTAKGRITAVLISHELWQRRYAADPEIVGRLIESNNISVAVAGVLPQGFQVYLGQDTQVPARIDLWFSAGMDGGRQDRGHTTIARLAPGVTIEQARAETAVLSARLTSEHGDAYGRTPLRLVVDRLQDDAVREARPALLALMGAVCFVLLIAGANVANLLLARITSRGRELAVRSAIGAERLRLVRQLITEGLVLGTLGGTAGVLLALWGESLLVWMRPPGMPPMPVETLTPVPLTFAVILTIAVSVLFSLAPAIQGLRADAGTLLRASSRSGHTSSRRLRTALLVAEVALSVVLLIGAGLMLRTLAALNRVALGFDASNVLTAEASLRPTAFRELRAQWEFYRRAMEDLRALPGVQSVSATYPLPLSGQPSSMRVSAADSGRELLVRSQTTLPEYFSTLRIDLREGRDFVPADIEQQRGVVIVDDSLARALWPGQSAIGRQLRGIRRGAMVDLGEVIGVAAPVVTGTLRRGEDPLVYLPYHQRPFLDLSVVVRASGDPMQLSAAVKKTVESLGAMRPVSDIRPMSGYVGDAVAESRFVLTLLGIFAGVALVLCAVGLYGVIAYTTAQRTHEIGIRVALGAAAGDIRRLVLGEGLRWTGVGVAAGLAGAALATRALDTLLFGVARTDAATLAAVCVLLTAVACAACLIPARQASRIAASEALRTE